ncbi:MAG TPA: aminotransferase class I/II-fold pyridoxal phosphate-dependent enzyme [Candidatus Omnitrophota bacterium]|nr:aminotransferase class I/II-fold pyridoxal phosphate-dependent enzyme [Candidatus Omnitrophota bacterium]
MVPGPSKVVTGIPPSGIRAFFDLVLGMKDVISLGVGEPDFVTPWSIRESAIYSLEQGYTSYTSNWGMKELRKAISRFLIGRHGVDYDYENAVLITVGASEATDLVLRAILNPGDEVIIPDPCFVSYGPLTVLAGGKPVFIPTSLETGFKMSPAQIRKALTPRTKAILINYPSNPTGASYSRKELLGIAAVAREKNLLVISDEIYDELTYEGEHTAFPSLPGMKERTIYLNGFSKAYAMTGWRIGYACGPSEIIGAMMKIHQYSMMCVSITGQFAALEALRSGLKEAQEMKKEYFRRRNFIVEELNRIGLTCHTPEGAFYVFPSVKKTGMNGVEFATRLLKREKVAVVPGIAFSPRAADHLRFSYATAFDDIREALRRIERFLSVKS